MLLLIRFISRKALNSIALTETTPAVSEPKATSEPTTQTSDPITVTKPIESTRL